MHSNLSHPLKCRLTTLNVQGVEKPCVQMLFIVVIVDIDCAESGYGDCDVDQISFRTAQSVVRALRRIHLSRAGNFPSSIHCNSYEAETG